VTGNIHGKTETGLRMDSSKGKEKMNCRIWRMWGMPCAIGVLASTVNAGMPAEPCTLYKPADITRARENIKRYRWAQAVKKGWERNVAHLMTQDREFIKAMLPELTGWTTYGNNCPVCVGKQSTMGECGTYKWSAKDPDKLVCKYCQTEYPNEAYPETGRLVCPKMGQTFSYYETEAERAHPESTDKHAFRWASWPVNTSWSGYIRTMKAAWCMKMLPPLSKLYAVTGEVQYAERTVWILDRMAQVYPNWLYHTYNGMVADCPPAEAAAELGRHPRAGKFAKDVVRSAHNLYQYKDHARLCVGFWGAGRLGTGSAEGSYLLNATVAYDLVRNATFPDGRRVMSEEVEKRIVDYVILAGCRDRENWAEINNKAGPNRALSAAVGILFEQPTSVRRALDGFERLLQDCFHTDGFCKESPSYSGMHLVLMANIPIILRGYSDPPGYVPEKGERFDNFDPFRHISRYRLALESMVRMATPGRKCPVIGDTSHRAGISSRYAEVLTYHFSDSYAPLLEELQRAPLEKKGGEYALWLRDPDLSAKGKVELPLQTEWFPDWHVGVLRAGKPQGDTALFLNAYASHGHRHYDTLGLILYGYGKEMASDRGYIWDDPRNVWTKCSLSHNLVTVDHQDQQRKGRSSVLELFGTGQSVEVVQARGEGVYSQCDVYRRTCALVQVDNETAYVVDVFRVRGGKTHQYGFQCNGKLEAFSGGELLPVDDEHKWLSNFRACQPDGDVMITWRDADRWLDLRLLTPCARSVIADAPGWRSDKGSELDAPPIQQLFAERSLPADSEEGLSSDFVAILSPHRGKSAIRSTTRLDTPPGSVAVKIETDQRTDWIMSSTTDAVCQFGPIRTDAAFAFVSTDAAGMPIDAYMLGGSVLECSAVKLSIEKQELVFDVARVEGRTIHLANDLPEATHLLGQYVLAAGTGYEVEAVEKRAITVRDYPVSPCKQIRVLNSAELAKR